MTPGRAGTAAGLAAGPSATMDRIAALHEERVKPLVHQRW